MNYFSVSKIKDYIFKSIIFSKEELGHFKTTLENVIGIKVINDIEDVMVEHEYLYGLNFHCNNEGQKVYTNILSDNITSYVKEY